MNNKTVSFKRPQFCLDVSEFDRVLKRIEQGCSTVNDARFIKKYIAGIEQRTDIRFS